MFSFRFTLANPFKPWHTMPKDYVCYDRKLTEHKSFELQISRWSPDLILNFNIDTQWYGRDHGGIEFSIELFGYYFAAKIYDDRHWDYEEHCWEKYENYGQGSEPWLEDKK